MSGRLVHVLQRPLPLGIPVLLLGVTTLALCPPTVRLVLLALSAVGSVTFAMTQFWFERRPRWMRGVQFDRAAARSWWVLVLLVVLTAVLFRQMRTSVSGGVTDAAVICVLPLMACLYALSLQGHTRLS